MPLGAADVRAHVATKPVTPKTPKTPKTLKPVTPFVLWSNRGQHLLPPLLLPPLTASATAAAHRPCYCPCYCHLQGEPEFDRLKRELEEVKHAHRGLDGTYRSTAELERHRAQLADAAIEEQLEVQTAFREQGSRLQTIYEKKQRAEYDMSKRCVCVVGRGPGFVAGHTGVYGLGGTDA